MKQIQIKETHEPIAVTTTTDGEAVKVSAVGPLTVACQMSISSASIGTPATAQLQGSLDGENFFNVGTPASVAGDGELCVTDTSVAFAWYRVQFKDVGLGDSFTVTETWFVYGSTV